MWKHLRCVRSSIGSKISCDRYELQHNRAYPFGQCLNQKAEKSQLYPLISAFRNHGHKFANLNPISAAAAVDKSCLDPQMYGLYSDDEYKFSVDGLISAKSDKMMLKDILKFLHQTYCSHIGVEMLHLPDEEKVWFASSLENMQCNSVFSLDDRKSFLEGLLKAQMFEKYLAVKFSTVKRYGLEGAESVITFFQMMFKRASLAGCSDVVIGCPHRGRLTLLCVLLKLPPAVVFHKMKGFSEYPENFRAVGDVLSHLRTSTDLDIDGVSLHVSMLPNPSHLEVVSPVLVGKTRAMLQRFGLGDYSDDSEKSSTRILPVQVHGDASFSGQGIVMETLAMSKVPHFRVGGCVHFVVNNQLGFTTPSNQGRSSRYCSDIGKMIDAPVIHVNSYFPEEVAKAAVLAVDYRNTFQKDVLVDMVCFRRHGHNEMDDPSFTNPTMYQRISSLKSAPDEYFKILEETSVVTVAEKESLEKNYSAYLDENLKTSSACHYQFIPFTKRWKSVGQAAECISVWDTGLPLNLLKFIGSRSVKVPSHLTLHPTLMKHFVNERLKKLASGLNIDWATAEALSVGSLLCQGYNVRLSGQDVGRGTFSQRHFSITDQTNDDVYVPLNNIFPTQKTFLEVANSILSEEGVLGFEYGFSIDNPDTLVIWEAQFGDFFNCAQVIFDTCISSSEAKWLLQTGIVILLPHGYDGGGPEHSSCRIERFLQMCNSKEDEIDGESVNWAVVNPTLPSQFYHLLRKQMICNYRRPLVVVAPKVILRHPSAVSSLSDMSPGTFFKPVIIDGIASAKHVKNLVFCSGKHYYSLCKEREARKKTDTALIRLEQLCPFPADDLHKAMKMFNCAKTYTWSQEEPQNMGAWSYVDVRFQNLFGCKLKYAGRRPLSAAAVGIHELHKKEAEEVLMRSFEL